MNLLSLFTIGVVAAETIVSPLPDPAKIRFYTPQVNKTTVSFAQLATPSISNKIIKALDWADLPGRVTSPIRLKKSGYTIALLGDSMIDTLGSDLPELRTTLRELYPGVNFRLLNYGVGATNLDYGIERLTNGYTYLGRNFPSLISQNPDLLIIESFGYNPLSLDRDTINDHWLKLVEAVNLIKQQLPQTKIVITSTIAPNAQTFGNGAGLAFSGRDKESRVAVIKSYLENAIRFAKSQKLPFADAFHPSLDSNGNGKLSYINPVDNIHYSAAGRQFFSQKIAEAITTNRLLE